MNDIPACNVAPAGDTVFGIVYAGMVHVSDMRALLNPGDVNHQGFGTVGFSSPISTEPFFAGTGLFGMALEGWLGCFVGDVGNESGNGSGSGSGSEGYRGRGVGFMVEA